MIYYVAMFYVMYIYNVHVLLFVRFSPFVKSGTEHFILGLTHLKREPKENEIVKIIVSVNINIHVHVLAHNYNSIVVHVHTVCTLCKA